MLFKIKRDTSFFVLGLFSATTAFLISRFNSKYLFLFSIGFFALGCIGTVFAPTYELLLASRLVQATGAGISLPLIQVVALLIYPKERYGYAMGLVGLIVGVAPAVGPAISGVIVDVWCWQGIFPGSRLLPALQAVWSRASDGP